MQLINCLAIFNCLQTEAEEAIINKKRSKKIVKKLKTRQKTAKVDPALEEQFQTGRVIGEYKLLNLNLNFPLSLFIFKSERG